MTSDFGENTQIIWIRSVNDVWALAEVINKDTNSYQIRYPNQLEDFRVDAVDTQDVCDTGIGNLTNMVHLNEANILEALDKRYRQGKIYTLTGEVLIAINPFKTLDIYELSEFGLQPGYKELMRSNPHVYHSALNCLERLETHACPQSILVSGESGAGKTQTTKYLMTYLSHLSSQANTNKKASQIGIESILLESNPILESFGNSKTRRNENSSRFGKYIKIDFTGRIITGANIETYLLETIRLINHHNEELNFHFIYALKQYLVESCLIEADSQFNYAKEDNITSYIPFQTTRSALDSMNFSEMTIQSIINLISGILYLGNYTGEENNNEVCLLRCHEYLGLKPELLEKGLTSRQRTIGGELIETDLARDEIIKARDSLSKSLYGALFNYIVEGINKTINPSTPTSTSTSTPTLRPIAIAILDIFGFEVFCDNGFEQLCINYTNERLQSLFNNEMIQAQQLEYQKEGLSWEAINFIGNDQCLRELDKYVFTLLDEATQLASSGDNTFINRLKQDATYKYLKFPKQEPAPYFTVTHFAGPVDYRVGQLTERNADAVHPQLVDLLYSSSHEFITTIANRIPKKNVSSLAFKSISYQFRNSLSNLIEGLTSCDLHYIRCLKPNDQDLANNFIRTRVVEQLRYSGVLEAVRVSRAGFPIRMKHGDYNNRYNKIPDYLNQKEGIIKGNTKFFIKNSAYLQLEGDLTKLRYNMATLIQSKFRTYLVYLNYQYILENIRQIQSCYRMVRCYRILKTHKMTRLIQTSWRCHVRQSNYRLLYRKILLVEKLFKHTTELI